MSTLRPLPRATALQLKHAAFLMGLPSTGTKADLRTILQQKLSTPQRHLEGYRVTSVDMGIRNLAFCVAEVLPRTPGISNAPSSGPHLRVSLWQRRDLLVTNPGGDPTDDQAKLRGRRDIASNAFTPSALSKTAHKFTADLLRSEPNIILIERQRYRSQGAAAVQEWTLRVNMLEGMIWACLRTMHENGTGPTNPFPTVYEVSPARVANFWAAPPNVSLLPTAHLFGESSGRDSPTKSKNVSRNRMEKKQKIALVRSWLDGNRDVTLEFTGQAADVAEVFRARTRRKGDTNAHVGKLDDLADCLLQAATWCRWEENARTINRLISEEMIPP